MFAHGIHRLAARTASQGRKLRVLLDHERRVQSWKEAWRLTSSARVGDALTLRYCQSTSTLSLAERGRDPTRHPLASLSTTGKHEQVDRQGKARNEGSSVYRRRVDQHGQSFALGSRKRSRAKVWIRDGSGEITVNGRQWVDYFARLDHRDKILYPFTLVGLTGKLDVSCTVAGGGVTGQAEAIRHGIARALQNRDPLLRPTLKAHGMLTRDSREVESKKYGRKKARKAFQWVKR